MSSKYFRLIGWLELIGAIIVIIWRAVETGVDIAFEISKKGGALLVLSDILILLAVILIAPALGLMFLSHANLLDEQASDRSRLYHSVDGVDEFSDYEESDGEEGQQEDLDNDLELTTLNSIDLVFEKDNLFIKEVPHSIFELENIRINDNSLFFIVSNERFEIKCEDNCEAEELIKKIEESSNFSKDKDNDLSEQTDKKLYIAKESLDENISDGLIKELMKLSFNDLEKALKDNKEGKTYILSMDDVKADFDTIKIKGSTYNAGFLGVKNISMSNGNIFFSIAGRNYRILYSDIVEATKFFDFLEKYKF